MNTYHQCLTIFTALFFHNQETCAFAYKKQVISTYSTVLYPRKGNFKLLKTWSPSQFVASQCPCNDVNQACIRNIKKMVNYTAYL